MNVENGTVQMSPEESGTIFAVEDESCSDGDMDNEEYAYDQEEFDVDFQGQGDHETLPSIKFSADSLTNSEVEQDMDDLIEKVKQFVPPEVSLDTVKLVLDQNGWDFEKSITTLSNDENGVEGYCSKTHIPFPKGINSSPPLVAESICRICASPCKEYHPHGDCDSVVCLPCWKNWIRTSVMDDGRTCITCPVCPMFLEDRLIKELAADGKVVKRLTANSNRKFIQISKNYASCPAPACQFIFRSKLPLKSYSGWKPALCQCGGWACLECLSLWHGPMSCESLKIWLGLNGNNDLLTNQWIKANSKPCPKCSTNIEKTGGCNWMRCTNPGCGYNFCWICLQKAHDHTQGDTCSRFVSTQPPPVPGEVVNARFRQERYDFYSERYHNMITGGRFNHIQGFHIDQARTAFQQNSTPETDLKLLEDLPALLKQSKLTLGYAYGLIYLLENTAERSFFEDSLAFLQTKVDGLEWYLQYQIQIESPKQIRDFLWQNMKFCRDRISVMNTTSESNYKNGKWEFDPVIISHKTAK